MSEITELTQQVADLTTSTTNLTNTVVGQVERLSADVAIADQKATEAANSAIASEDSAVAANTHEANAKVEADRAKSEADNASAVVSGGTATLVSEAGKIPLADSDGKIDLDWLPAEAQGYNVFAQEQAVNGDKFAASGFVHMGNHFEDGNTNIAVNDGIWCNSALSNALYYGRGTDETAINPKSKINTPLVNIAGVTSTISMLNHLSIHSGRNKIKFPEAPNGTVTYDSATGVITDYTKDVDPKYGDVAPDVNEAVARAFEGDIKNGDFRFGDDGSWTDQGIGFMAIADGSATCTDAPTNTSMTQSRTYTANTYLVMVSGVFTLGETFWITLYNGEDGNVYHAFTGTGANQTVYATLSVTADSQLYIQNRSGVTLSYEVSSTSVQKVTTEVVTERVDMWGFEGWLEEVSQANPYVYQNGLIQSQATDIDGVSTGDSNRPDTYYAVFDGDTTSRGNGVNFWSISDAQRKDIFSNPDNKLYLIDGKIYQWRLRQRTIAGAGNGDFHNVESTTLGSGYDTGIAWSDIGKAYPQAQGRLDDVITSLGGSSNMFLSTGSTITGDHLDAITGGFVARSTYRGAFGHCYFLVCGTVSRLNQGAYHPSFNAMGASNCYYLTGSTGSWHDTDNPLLSERDCFDYADGWNAGTGKVPAVGNRGGINSGISGRPDSRFFDAIYADGLGGVVLDTRYSAWDKSAPEHKAKALAMVENGTYRGVEKLVETAPFTLGSSGRVNGFGIYHADSLPSTNTMQIASDVFKVNDYLSVGDYFIVKWEGEVVRCKVTTSSSAQASATYEGVVSFRVYSSVDQSVNQVLFETTKNHSVGGEFQLTEVIGDPANILANPDLQNGWLGVWNPTIPDGSGVADWFSLSRKSLTSSVIYDASHTEDSGATYGTNKPTSADYSTVTNGLKWSQRPNRVFVQNYTAFAKQTKPSTNQPVFNGEAGVGSVFGQTKFTPSSGSLLAESLIGTPLVTNIGGVQSVRYTPDVSLVSTLDGMPMLYSNTGYSSGIGHGEMNFGAPSNNSPAVKTLTTQLNVNDQASIQFQYEELVHNGTDWGDDGNMFVTSTGDSTNTDENGTVVKCGVHELAVPYGWCKVEV